MNAPHDAQDESRAIVLGPAGVRNLGEIDDAAAAAAKVLAGPIRLLWGYPGAKGWGLQHVASNTARVKAIERQGFDTPTAYAYAVAANWTALHAGPGPNKLTAAWYTKGMALQIALRREATFWSITTMLPFTSVSYPKLYEKCAA